MSKTRYCDGCHEQHEAAFFCEQCSGSEYDTDLIEVPNVMWDGYPGQESVYEERGWVHYAICLNCCNCHLTLNATRGL